MVLAVEKLDFSWLLPQRLNDQQESVTTCLSNSSRYSNALSNQSLLKPPTSKDDDSSDEENQHPNESLSDRSRRLRSAN